MPILVVDEALVILIDKEGTAHIVLDRISEAGAYTIFGSIDDVSIYVEVLQVDPLNRNWDLDKIELCEMCINPELNRLEFHARTLQNGSELFYTKNKLDPSYSYGLSINVYPLDVTV